MEEDFNLFNRLCSYDNLELAYRKARKRKTLKNYVMEFEKNLKQNLLDLRSELIFHTYRPKPLKTFIVRDPKTRKISKSHFRDRVVHHALCNIIEPIFEKSFIYDSYANRMNKGAHKAIQRFDYFKRKVSKNNSSPCYVLKADIKHYFENVNHKILLNIIKRKMKDERIIWLIKIILQNHRTSPMGGGGVRFGMPLGNLTSQFFANIYLDELDQFVKHELKAKYYIRYVDDFVILHHSKKILAGFNKRTDDFLKSKLSLELHPNKSYIIQLDNGVTFLGFRIFFYYRLIKKSNIKKFEAKLRQLQLDHKNGIISKDKALDSLEGWMAYLSHADTYKYRNHLIMSFNQGFALEQTKTQTIKNNKDRNFVKKAKITSYPFSSQKTLQLYKKGISIKEIARQRGIKESTVWEHLAKLIEYNQLPVLKVLPKAKIDKILLAIRNVDDKLKDIKERLNVPNVTFDEINCVLAHYKNKSRKKVLLH